MFEIKNGILYKDGKKSFGLGAAYYASFHKKKMAVPPFGDQYGEMKKDIAAMKEAGFNIVRTSALGNFDCSDGEGNFVSSPFIDEMMKTIEEHGLAAFIRIQGYSMKLKNYPDASMVSSDGKLYTGLEWANFLNDSIHHTETLRDNLSGTRKIAEHYKNMKPVVSFITYNEPHYPANGVYDYSDYAIADYREWLKENNIKLSDNIDSYEPPRRRPYPGERLEEWIYWRLFSIRSLSKYLCDTAAVSKKVNPKIQSITCMTPNMIEFDNYIKGCDYFEVADGMDMLGITIYKNSCGGDYYAMDLILNCAQSAAAVNGKHAWMVELDAGTKIPLSHFNRETLMTVGSGYKGIIYYQWRGDYPFEKAPEPNMFGFINSDGSRTENYDEKINMLKLLSNLSGVISDAEKVHNGVAVLYSDYATMYSDAVDNIHETTTNVWKNTYNSRLRRYYKELKCTGVTVDIVKSEHLKDNRLNVKALFIPEYSYLSEKEKSEVLDFQKNGGKVFIQSCDKWQKGLEKCGFDELGVPQERYTSCYEVEEALEYAGITPSYEVLTKTPLGINLTEGERYYLMSVVNISNLHDKLKNIRIRMNSDIISADIHMPGSVLKADVKDNIISISEICDGALIIVNKK